MRLEGIGDANTGRGQRTLTRRRREANAFGIVARPRRTGRGIHWGPDVSLGHTAASILRDCRAGSIVMIAGHMMALTGKEPRPNAAARTGSARRRAADLVGTLPHQVVTSIETVHSCARRGAMAKVGKRGAWAAAADASVRAGVGIDNAVTGIFTCTRLGSIVMIAVRMTELTGIEPRPHAAARARRPRRLAASLGGVVPRQGVTVV